MGCFLRKLQRKKHKCQKMILRGNWKKQCRKDKRTDHNRHSPTKPGTDDGRPGAVDGGVVGYVNRMRVKYTANCDTHLAESPSTYHRFVAISEIPDRISSRITIFFTILSSSTEALLIPPYNPSNAKGIKIQTRFRISAVNSPSRL